MTVQLLKLALGLWLMAAPAVLGYGDPATSSDRIVGPLTAALAVVAIAPVTRPLGRVTALCGLWLLVAPLALSYPIDAAVNSILVGAAVIVLSQLGPRGTEHFGGGWSALWRHEEPKAAAKANRDA
jgi:hypothetical protein